MYTREWKPARSAGVSERSKEQGGQNRKSGQRVFTTTPWQEEPRLQEKDRRDSSEGRDTYDFSRLHRGHGPFNFRRWPHHGNLFDDSQHWGVATKAVNPMRFHQLSLTPWEHRPRACTHDGLVSFWTKGLGGAGLERAVAHMSAAPEVIGQGAGRPLCW